jgi:hypothetical protein
MKRGTLLRDYVEGRDYFHGEAAVLSFVREQLEARGHNVDHLMYQSAKCEVSSTENWAATSTL